MGWRVGGVGGEWEWEGKWVRGRMGGVGGKNGFVKGRERLTGGEKRLSGGGKRLIGGEEIEWRGEEVEWRGGKRLSGGVFMNVQLSSLSPHPSESVRGAPGNFARDFQGQ